MRWLRLWVDETINGTTFTELNAEQRGVWYTLLVLAAHSPKPGTICIAEGLAYTREQIASFTKLGLDVLDRGINHLKSPGIEKITINPDGTISICNWLKYQTEYDRQKGYRRGLQGKVTRKGYEQELQEDSPVTRPSISISSSVSKNNKDVELAKFMFSLIRTLNQKHKEPNFEAWANDIRLTRERDGRTDEEIRALFEWANRHDFWKTNILCPATLRKQWDKLVIQRDNPRNGNDQQPKPGKMARAAEALRRSNGTAADSATANDRGTGAIPHAGPPARLRTERG